MKNLKKIAAIAMVLLGLITIIIGAGLKNTEFTEIAEDYSGSASYSFGRYSITGYAFGADFYTEMYNGSKTIVDELDDIGNGVEAAVKAASESAKINAISIRANAKLASAVVIAIGLAILAFAVFALGSAFTPEKEPTVVVNAPAAPPAPAPVPAPAPAPAPAPEPEPEPKPEPAPAPVEETTNAEEP